MIALHPTRWRNTAPHRVQALIGLGLVGFSILYTWAAPRIAG